MRFYFLSDPLRSLFTLVTNSLTDWLTNSLTDFHFCHAKNNSRNLWSLRHLIRVMRRHDFMTLSTLSTFCILIILRQILTIWRTVWETWHLRHRLQFWRLRTWIQSVIVTWQLIVTLDSIRNSCDVFKHKLDYSCLLLLRCFSFSWSSFPFTFFKIFVFSQFWKVSHLRHRSCVCSGVRALLQSPNTTFIRLLLPGRQR